VREGLVRDGDAERLAERSPAVRGAPVDESAGGRGRPHVGAVPLVERLRRIRVVPVLADLGPEVVASSRIVWSTLSHHSWALARAERATAGALERSTEARQWP
jgi:hypothetical protein